MQASLINSHTGSMPATAMMPMIKGRPDYQLADALTKVSAQAQVKAKATATDFEAMFLNSMFSQMTSGIKGEGPFGDTPGTGVWRSMLTEQYSKSFAKAGGVGISNEVYRMLILRIRDVAGDILECEGLRLQTRNGSIESIEDTHNIVSKFDPDGSPI